MYLWKCPAWFQMFHSGAKVMLSNRLSHAIKCSAGLEPNCLPRCRTDLWHGTNISVFFTHCIFFCSQSSKSRIFGGFVVDYRSSPASWKNNLRCLSKCQLIFVLLTPVSLMSNLQFSWEGEISTSVAEFGQKII